MNEGPWWTWPMVRILGWAWGGLTLLAWMLDLSTYDGAGEGYLAAGWVLVITCGVNEMHLRGKRRG